MILTIENLESGLDQIRGAAGRLDRELRSAQKRAQKRRDRFAEDLQTRAKTSLREARERAQALRVRVVAQLESALEQNPVAERVEDLRKTAGKRFARGIERALAALPVASRREVEQMNRKLNRLQRKLRNIEKTRSA